MVDMQTVYSTIGNFFIHGDVAAAIAYMKEIPELNGITQAYVDLFENEQYISYDIPDDLNRILLCYQQYFRKVFYLHREHEEAKAELFDALKKELALPDAGLSDVEDEMKLRFNRADYQVLFGITNGYYGPYVWKETAPVTFEVELPEAVSTYRINMLRGFVFRSWMDYLTFGEKGTGGWALPDGTINCVEKAYDLNSERFKVSLLKHEAQHAEDYKRWESIEPCHLEYRAKLVELIYTEETNLLAKFCSEADPERTDDSHALASARIKSEMGDLICAPIPEIQARARELFAASSKEMDDREKKRKLYERQKALLDTFLANGAISRRQYDKSLGDLTEKMGYGNEEKICVK